MSRDKFKKLAVTVFLSLLIWIWAYRALEETISETGYLNIHNTNEELLVNFVDEGQLVETISLNLALKGPAGRITELQRSLYAQDGEDEKVNLNFYYNLLDESVEGNSRTLNVFEFIRESEKIEKFGLTVVSCRPETVTVRIEQLEKKWLAVSVQDESGNELRVESVVPPRVEIASHKYWSGDLLSSTVTLTDAQIERARNSSVVATPYVILSNGKRRHASTRVKIKLPATEESLKDQLLQPRRIGFVFSQNLQGKYKAQLLNEADLTSTTNFKATDEAFAAYRGMAYQVLIMIQDGDENSADELLKDPVYNFPREFVEKGEIKLSPSQKAVKARIKLLPIGEAVTEPDG